MTAGVEADLTGDSGRMIAEFREAVWSNYRERGRSLPWRDTDNPWLILVSEIMLQQTQVDRVLAYWLRWRELWPSPAALAATELGLVLREWNGLGYNRRARYLRDCAITIVDRFGGLVPRSVADLEALPGIGPYTARAVACFAYGTGEVFIETNIRAVALHFFFPGRQGVDDRELLPFLEAALDTADPRRWYWALMDYGAGLKKLSANPNRRSAHYGKQARFEGSLRQARGAVLKRLAAGGAATLDELAAATALESDRLRRAIDSLRRDGLVAEDEAGYKVGESAVKAKEIAR